MSSAVRAIACVRRNSEGRPTSVAVAIVSRVEAIGRQSIAKKSEMVQMSATRS